jgi:hypothetical protein
MTFKSPIARPEENSAGVASADTASGALCWRTEANAKRVNSSAVATPTIEALGARELPRATSLS